MDDFDCGVTVSTKSSLDSGFDNGFDNDFLSDSSSSSGKSDSYPTTAASATCVFEKIRRGKKDFHCCALNYYSLSGRCLETLSSKTFLYLANCVRVLDLSKNRIKMLPETIGELSNLQELNLSCNELQSVPDSCARLKMLRVLNLSQNKLSEPPTCLELGMEKITCLDLSRNTIAMFPNPPKCSLLLQSLNLSHNCFNLLPLWLFSDQCRSLTELDISFNYCFDDPSLQSQLLLLKHHRISVLKTLSILRMCNTGANPRIGSPISSFECLRIVHMGNTGGPESTFNYFSEIKVNLFFSPECIIELYLQKVGLAGLPEDINRLKNLEVLDASNNQLDWLPESIGSLKSLRELILSDCNLSYLPDSFGELKNLKKLVIDHNKLSDIQSPLSGCLGLKWLDVYDNHLEESPVSHDRLRSLHMVDLAYNFVDLESALDVEVNGERLYDVYCRQQVRLRETMEFDKIRNVGCKSNSATHSWESLESLYKSHRSGSLSDFSQSDGNTSYQYCTKAEDESEENWDEDSGNENDKFEPDSVHRYHLPLGQYNFGWVPPVKRRPVQVPIHQQVSGHVFLPRQTHQRTTSRRKRRKLKDLPVADGQFEDASVDHFAGLERADSLGALLTRMRMFVRNPAGLRCRRRCRFHSPYEDCLHHGLWFRLSPPVTFEIPDQVSEDEEDI